jgi:NAD+ diphosphatase
MALDLWYTGSPLDRASHLREDETWIYAHLKNPESRVVPVWRNRNLVSAEAPVGFFPTVAEAGDLLDQGQYLAMLGIYDDVAHFAVDLSAQEDPYVHPVIEAKGVFEDLRKMGPVVDRDEAAIMAYARGLMTWHSRHLFCGVCGSPTDIVQAGHERNCINPECEAKHFPRTDPAVIMLVTREDMCLLGRSYRFQGQMYSTLAGFVEPGESLEEAVAREVFEEVGVRVGECRYLGSQPWPFPASIMLGFHATAETTEITVNTDELQDARWLSRAEMEDPESVGISLPRRDSIAYRLIQTWLDRGA